MVVACARVPLAALLPKVHTRGGGLSSYLASPRRRWRTRAHGLLACSSGCQPWAAAQIGLGCASAVRPFRASLTVGGSTSHTTTCCLLTCSQMFSYPTYSSTELQVRKLCAA